ncbi:beta 1,4 glucosyltransferase [Paenibacillus antibioticophila]|uniref:Beta 1,4 glucosyltransferase n=1 Tax=Paenibacillus antibioticophila TaxID=1274374 RepID=A0A920CEQ0_9BACL|nr:glycosyltransferase [Paenibacillus antibioticophila]GIO37256.1 beta 1,4 glucosyltransferase [Paenibacillus antibioticophila]
MITISLCMIVKNEEEVLARCLDSAKDIVDEINIIDTGSTDRTIEIAKQYTDRVFHFPWTGSFSEARNHAFTYATKEYILYLDADDVILEGDRQTFLELKKTLDPAVDSVSMFYNAGMDEFGNVTLRYRRNRLVKTAKHFQWRGEVHNYLDVSGYIINSDVAITHKKTEHKVGRNLKIYETKIARGDTFSARDYFYYGNELRENGHYEKAIESYEENLKLREGWVEDKINACINMADCYRFLGNMQQEFASLCRSFDYSKPRAEVASRLGYYFYRKNDYHTAIFWYDLATKLPADTDQWSFSFPAYWTWYPHLHMSVCYYRLGLYKESYLHNEEARKYRPDDKSIVHNKKLLEEKLKITDEQEQLL